MFKNAAPTKIDYLLILRGLAAIGVLIGHCCAIGKYSLGVFISNSPYGVYVNVAPPLDHLRTLLFYVTPILGTNFVILFFVQSGYLMGKVFYDEKYALTKAGIRNFYLMRYLRLAPLLYFNLLVAFAFFIGAGLSLKMIIGDVLFITNFTDRGLNLVTWSLSHEMQYYLICPLVFFAFRKVDLRSLVLCLGLIVATYYVTRHGFLAHFEYVYAFIAGFFVNILIRLVPLRANEGTKLFGLVLGMAALDIVFNWLSFYGKSAQAGFAAVMISGALVFLMELPGNTALSDRFGFVRRLAQFGVLTGNLTYGIYLWHYMIVRTRSDAVAAYVDRLAAAGRLTQEWQKILVFHLGQVSLILIVSYTLAWITFHLIEVRFRPGLYKPAGNKRAAAAPAATEPSAVLASTPANTVAS